MTQITRTGNEYLGEVAADVAESPDLPFKTYLSFGDLSSEDWSSATYDPDAKTMSATWKSKEGSSMVRVYDETGSEKSGSDKGSLSVNSKSSGIKITTAYANKWSEKSTSDSKNLSWIFTGDPADKTDDLKLDYSSSNTTTQTPTASGTKGYWKEHMSVEFSNAMYQFKQIISGDGTWFYDNQSQKNTSNQQSTSLHYAFHDVEKNLSLNFSGKLTEDEITGVIVYNFTNVKFSSREISMSTSKWTWRPTVEDHSSVPDISFNAGSFEIISSNILQTGTPLLFFDADNAISVVSEEGSEVNTGAGADKVLGNRGDDTILGGAGADQITGGKGADLFVFGAGDSLLSAKSADQIKDFKVAEGDQIKLDAITDIDCRVSNLKALGFAAAQAEADRDFLTGSNISVQFVGNNALMFVDFDGDSKADSAITLTGLKAGNSVFVAYAQSGEMFA